MPDKTWKAAERKIARLLGGDRVGPTGKATPDVMVDARGVALAIEVKTRKRLPRWLMDAMEQSRANAGTRVPVVVLHQIGDRYEEATVCLDLKVFKEILEGRG